METLRYFRYSDKLEIIKTFDSFGDAIKCAEMIAGLSQPLTRSSSVGGAVQHYGVYADLYNEIALTINIPV